MKALNKASIVCERFFPPIGEDMMSEQAETSEDARMASEPKVGAQANERTYYGCLVVFQAYE